MQSDMLKRISAARFAPVMRSPRPGLTPMSSPSALLHDAVEETENPAAELAAEFGLVASVLSQAPESLRTGFAALDQRFVGTVQR